jgi:hypothetical protein
MATWTSYDQVGLAEDVSDVISNISPTKTPFQSMVGREKISARNPEWQEDALDAVEEIARVEGHDPTEATLVATVMRQNYTQILEKTIKVSATSDALKHYGRAKESAYQVAKKMAEIKRHFEHVLVGLDTAAVAGDSSTARKMANVYPQIHADTTTQTPDSDAGTGGTQPGPLTEANVLSTLQKVFDAGGDASVLMIKPADSLIVADFAKASGRNRDFAQAKKVVNAVDLYVSPFGEVRVVLNRFIKSTQALIFDPANWKILVLRNWFRETLAKTGDNMKMMIVGEFSLKHENQKASSRT